MMKNRRWVCILAVVIFCSVFSSGMTLADETANDGVGSDLTVTDSGPVRASDPPLPTEITAIDLTEDDGGKILITWKYEAPADVFPGQIELVLLRSLSEDGPFETITVLDQPSETSIDANATHGIGWFYRLGYRNKETGFMISLSDTIGPVYSRGSWFDKQRLNALLFLVIFTGILLYYIYAAQSGRELSIRKVTGLDSVEEAVGRATEMGRNVLFVPGVADISEIQTVAGLSILGHIAKITAQYASRIVVPNMDPLTYATAKELVREAFMSVGKPEAFQEDDVFFITSEQFAYTAAVTGLMVRQRPAANFFIGWFKAESLMLAETGQATGAIQIAGTAELDQLPFFVATCDYTLIGEELFAASAYLTRHPLLVSSIKGQDMAKALLIGIILVGLVAKFFGSDVVKQFMVIH